MIEYGIFSDEGILDGGFYSERAATEALRTTYAEDDAFVAAVCRVHPEEMDRHCPHCEEE